MKFEVIGPDGKGKMVTYYESCLPTKEQIKSMIEHGYKFKLDDKVLSKSAALELVSKPKSSKAKLPEVPVDRLF